MGCLQSRHSALMCNRATPPVSVSHQHTKCALSKPRPNKLRLAKSRPLFCQFTSQLPIQAVVDGLPKLKTHVVPRVVGLERDNIRGPVCRHRNPIGFLEEERVGLGFGTNRFGRLGLPFDTWRCVCASPAPSVRHWSRRTLPKQENMAACWHRRKTPPPTITLRGACNLNRNSSPGWSARKFAAEGAQKLTSFRLGCRRSISNQSSSVTAITRLMPIVTHRYLGCARVAHPDDAICATKSGRKVALTGTRTRKH